MLNNRVSFWVVQDSRNDKSPHLRVEHKYDLQTLQYWKEACKVKKRGGAVTFLFAKPLNGEVIQGKYFLCPVNMPHTCIESGVTISFLVSRLPFPLKSLGIVISRLYPG